MKKFWLFCVAVCCLSAIGTTAAKDDDAIVLKTSLRGINEVPPNNTPATGSFVATIHPDGTINFTLTYSNLTTTPLFSHIHFGRNDVNGGVMIFLCGGDAQPACPTTTSATITGTITSANVVGPAPQGVTAGDLATALRVINERQGYVNLHSTKFPGGEIRGQLRVQREDD
jgi:CHRD domain-containing protein